MKTSVEYSCKMDFLGLDSKSRPSPHPCTHQRKLERPGDLCRNLHRNREIRDPGSKGMLFEVAKPRAKGQKPVLERDLRTDPVAV